MNGEDRNTRSGNPVVAHLLVTAPSHGIVEHCIALVTALSRLGFEQQVLTSSSTLNRRLALCPNVDSGPSVHSAIGACCSVGDVDVVHAYDIVAAEAALMLRLTRSIPYCFEHANGTEWQTPVARMVVRRAAGVVFRSAERAATIQADLRHVRAAGIPQLHYTVSTVADGLHRDGNPVDAYVRLYRLAFDGLRGRGPSAN